MAYRLIRQCLLTFIGVGLLSACQHHPAIPRDQADAALYLTLSARLPAAEALPDYQQVQKSYLASDLVADRARQWRDFQQQLEQTELKDCLKLPWDKLQQQHWLQLMYYRQAIQCQLFHKNADQVKQLRAYQSWLRDGILRTGNGENSFSAWQIHNFGNALELVNLLGMSVLDYYGVLSANGNSLYYEVQVFDPLENRYRVLYFDNQRYMHALDHIPFPFIGLSDGWRKGLLPEGAKVNPALMVPLAKAMFEEGQVAQAEQLLLQAIDAKSYQATVLLADWCLQLDSKINTPRAQCLAYLLESADQDYLPALDLLYYFQFTHQVAAAKPDQQPLADYINERSKPGRAELQLARFLLQKQRKGADQHQALQMLERSYQLGFADAAAFASLVRSEQTKSVGPSNNAQETTLPTLQQQAEQGSSIAAYLYVSDLLQQDKISDADKAQMEPLLKQSVKAAHPEAYYLLGVAAENNLLTTENGPQAAAQFYQQAAEQFFSRAMFKMGQLYAKGQGVSADPVQASRWYYLCTRQGNVLCAYQAAVQLDDGEGMEADPKAAARLYQYAVEQGHSGAMNRLALLYLFGRGLPSDPKRAIELFTEAATLGSVSASYYLGLLYFEGQLVLQDLPKAHRYFEQAKQHPNARYYLDNWQRLSQNPQKSDVSQ